MERREKPGRWHPPTLRGEKKTDDHQFICSVREMPGEAFTTGFMDAAAGQTKSRLRSDHGNECPGDVRFSW